MTTATATDVKNHFGEYVDKAQQEPVSIEKNGRKHAVLLSQSEYERLQAIENAHWAQKAAEGRKSGYVGSDALMAAIEARLAE